MPSKGVLQYQRVGEEILHAALVNAQERIRLTPPRQRAARRGKGV